MTTQSHHDHVEKQFSSQASEYLTSTVHASGQDLQRLAVRLADYPDASVLDMGCGAGACQLCRCAKREHGGGV